MKPLTRAAVAAALALPLALSVAPSPAAAGARSETSFVVGHVADAPIPVAGRPLQLVTQLVDAELDGVPGREVTLQVRPKGADGFRTVDTERTNSNGAVGFDYTPRFSFRYRFVFAGDDAYLAGASGRIGQPVGPRVTIHVRDDELPQSVGRLVVKGDTGPNRAGREVRLYRGRTTRGGFGPDWHPRLLATGVVRPDGSYRLVARPRWAGERRVFVEVEGGGRNATGWSRYRWVDVRAGG